MTNGSNTNTSSVTDRLARLCQEPPRRLRGKAEVLDWLLEAVIRRGLHAIPQTGCREAMFFADPTDVGKTETTHLLAGVLFGSEAFVRLVLPRRCSQGLGARPLLGTIHELVGNAIANNLLDGGRGDGRLVIDGEQLRLVR